MTHPLAASVDTGLRKLQVFVMVSTALLIAFSISTSAVLRYLFKKDIYGLEEFITVAAFWMYSAGEIYAARTGMHIRAGIVEILFKTNTVRAWFEVARLTITTALSLLFTWWGWEFLYWGLVDGGKTPLLMIPQAVAQSSIFVGFLAMSMYFALDLAKAARQALSGIAPEAKGSCMPS